MFSNKALRLVAAAALSFVLTALAYGQVMPLIGAGPTGSAVVCVPSTAVSLTFTGGTISGLPSTTFTRASANGTYIDNGGVLQTATTNVARFNYDANYPRGNAAPSLTGPFLLYEPAATNVRLQSNAFTTTWVAINAGVATAAAFTSPDGTLDGWTLTSGSGFGGINQVLTFSNVAYASSIWAKTSVGTPAFRLTLNNFDGATTVLNATLKRLFVTGTPNAGSNVNSLVYLNSAAGNTAAIFGNQVELGAVATSYIATTTTAQTRATDALAFTVPSCVGHLTVTFDDNSTQSVAVSPGAYTLTTTLNRPNLKTIVGAS